MSRWLLALLGLSAISSAASADIIAYPADVQTTGNQTNGDTSLGMDFTVNQAINVTQMGAFDSGQNGFNNEVDVAIYNDSTQAQVPGTLVAFTALTGTNPGTLVGNNRFATLSTPVSLAAGTTYSIVYYNIAGNTEAFYNFFHNSSLNDANSGGGLITFTGNSRYGGTSAFPTNVDGSGTTSIVNYEAGTFAFVAAPEPASLALSSLAVTGLLCRRNRRNEV